MARVLDRSADSAEILKVDVRSKNKFRWEWLEMSVKDQVLSSCIRKIDIDGKAKCIVYEKFVNYASRGKIAIIDHCSTSDHIRRSKTIKENFKLPVSMTGPNKEENVGYGIHPMFKNIPVKKPESPKPCVSLEDRISNAQAMILATIAEHNLPFTMAPVLIDLAKELAKDPKALQSLSMDRTSASYKLVYGLGNSLTAQTLNKLRSTPFSLNLDEATNKSNKHVLTVLVNYFDADSQKVILEHLVSVELIKVDTDSIFDAICDLVEGNEIPWDNLVSILMDSCAVMRGCKNGLEKRIREEKANHLIDIDGDVCHHIHNGTKLVLYTLYYYLGCLQFYNDDRAVLFSP